MSSAVEYPPTEATPVARRDSIPWVNVTLAALLMAGTLPGRTQGLGLITEPMLKDLRLDRIAYANINLWATLLGAALCLPTGRILDRFGLRWVSGITVLLLGGVVWQMSLFHGGALMLFVWILLTRALGQSALSVMSITAVGKSASQQSGMAMGVYSVILSLLMATAFVMVGDVVSSTGSFAGWRNAWWSVALVLLLGIAPLQLLFFREPRSSAAPEASDSLAAAAIGQTLAQALRAPSFWIFAGATALFALASSGLGLFNEAVLAERGFNADTYHHFLAVTFLFGLVGQFGCGWLSRTKPMPKLMGVAMFLYGAGLATLPLLRSLSQLWIFAGIFGIAGGFVTTLFFAIWARAFGKAHLGRIQGAAQMLTVLASAIGPLLFEVCHGGTGSYAPMLFGLAPVVWAMGHAAWRVRLAE